jgi:2-dehydro-3-deoxygluconokinase
VSPRVLTVGETMALLDPVEDGPLELGRRLTLRVAGAESNFAVALARLGVRVAWASRVGDDRFGRLVRDALADEGVDLRWLSTSADAQTGVFFKWRDGGRSHNVYYRRGSAASELAPDDVPDEALDGVELVHLTGITTALGYGPRALVVDLARRARERGAIVTFDPNLRPALWPRTADAAAAQAEVLPYVDWYLCGQDEGCSLFGVQSPEALEDAARVAGARSVVIRLGARGALVRDADVLRAISPAPVDVVDEVGAGDAFAAGFAFGLLDGRDAAECVRLGNRVAARALRGTGDWETLPRREELGL